MRTISMFVLTAIMFLLHLMLAPVIEIFNAKIDFIMIGILLIAMFTNKWYPSVLCAVYSGLALDITTQITYVNTYVYLVYGLVLGFTSMFFKQKGFALAGIASFVCVASKHLVFVFLLYILRFSENITLGTFFYGIPSALYSAIAAMGIYFFYKLIFSFPFMQEKSDNDGKIII